MTDIVERLHWYSGRRYFAVAHDAADEIERLRQEKDLIFKRMEYATEEHAKLMVRMADSEKVIETARSLWDNRLGHGDPTGPWHSPQDFWKDLGQALVEYARD